MPILSFPRNSVLLLLTGLAATSALVASGAATPVWRIGEFDHSSAEFAQTTSDKPYPKASVTYVVGKSMPKDWPAFQPGSLNEKAGREAHPYTIRFNLPQVPQGRYTLKLALIAGSRSVVQVEINGKKGWAYQHPQWDKVWDDEVGGRRWLAWPEVELPTSALKQGGNTLILTAVDSPACVSKGDNPGLTYDALELDHDPDQNFDPDKLTAQIEPTMFYKQKDGQLVELVEAYIHHNSQSQDGRVGLAVGDKRLSGEFAPGRDFGEEHVEFAVPAFDRGTKAALSVTLDNKSQQLPMVLEPAKRWKLFLVPHIHLDVGYTDTDSQAKVAELQSRTLDEAMQLIHDHPDFRYSTDAYWVLQQFFTGRDPADQKKLIQLMKERKIFSPAQYVNLLTEFPGVETLVRSFYASFEFDRKNGLDFNYTNLTDVPSSSWSYASVMAAAGLKYFLIGSDPIRGPIILLGDLKARSPFWWEGPDGGKVLMWYSHSYGQLSGVFGVPATVDNGRNALPSFIGSTYMSPEYKSDAVILYGSQGENSDLQPTQASIVEEWNKTYAYPKLSYTDFSSALRQVADGQEGPTPVIKGDGGPYWEDGIYSDTHTAIVARENEQRAPSAEKISTISALVHPHVEPDATAVKELWQNILLTDEHTWGDCLSISTPDRAGEVRELEVKESYATQARQELDGLRDRGMLAIGDRIDVPAGTCVVFNPLNWRRSGWVELDLAKGTELVDSASGRTVPFQVLGELPNYIPQGHFGISLYRHIRFLAEGVPAVGYKCYLKRPEKSEAAPAAVTAGTVMENAYYRVVLDGESGAVSSIFDKELNTELVNAASPYRFDQYLYVTGGDSPYDNQILFSDPDLPIPPLDVRSAHGGRVRSIERAPFGAVAHLESTDTNTPRIETDVILFDSEKKIEFINHVRKEKVMTKEGVYFAFPFAMDSPAFRYDGQNGVIDPAHDLLPGAAREWFSLQHWITARQDGVTAALVPVDAELFTLGDIVRGTWPKELGPRGGTVFSYVMNNYWFTNYIAEQGGDFTFRYVLTSARTLDPAQLSRRGWEEMTPLEVSETTEIVKTDGRPLLPQPLNVTEASFLQVKQSNIVFVNWKRAEDGHGTILRFLEVGGQEGQVDVEIPIVKVGGAWMCNAMEENQHLLPTTAHGINFHVKPFQIITVRVEGTRSGS